LITDTLNALPATRLQPLESVGLDTHSISYVYRPSTIGGVQQLLEEARTSGRSAGLRGAGTGLGDAALNAENIAIEMTRMNRVLSWDPVEGRIEVEPGVTVGELWRRVIEDGWWPPVVPATMAATVGGAASVDAFGMNHWQAGSFADYVDSIEVLLPDGNRLHCSASENEELFRGTLGGLGLLGVIVGLRLRMKRISTGLLDVRRLKSRNLSDTFAMLEAWSGRVEYLTGWIDGTASGPALGRGVVLAGQHVTDEQTSVQTLRTDFQELPSLVAGVVPRSELWRLLRIASRAVSRFVNEAAYRAVKRAPSDERLVPLSRFLFLQDRIPHWQRAFKPGAVVRYQSFLPEALSRPVFLALLKRTHAAGLYPCLVTLSRHRGSQVLLARPLDGYSISMHFPLTAANQKRVFRLMAELTEKVVLPAGGRVMPVSSGNGSQEKAAQAYGADAVDRFLQLKREHDPLELLQSDLYRRVFPRP
jgi:decaprenylphospho-beta-D-ribofuranose 2-oxidase